MAVDNTRGVGEGYRGYTLVGDVFTWDEPLWPSTGGAFTKLVNVQRAERVTVVSHATNTAGLILSTTVTGDRSGWVTSGASKEGMLHTIDDNVAGALFSTTLLATVGPVNDTQYTWTDKVTRDQRFERSGAGTTFAISSVDGSEFGCDVVGVQHQFIPTAENHGVVLAVSAANNWAVRDVWFTSGIGRGFDWSSSTSGDTGVLERCTFTGSLSSQLGTIRLRSTGSEKHLTINHCELLFGAQEGNTSRTLIKAETTNHTVLMNHCTLWRVGTIFRIDHASATVTVKNSIVFGQRAQTGAGATATFTDCAGGSSIVGSGITEATEGECGLGYHHSPPGATEYPKDPASISSEGSKIKDQGSAIAGITLDKRGVAHDDTTPDIGPYEDHPGFGAPGATVPATAVLGAVNVTGTAITVPITGPGGATLSGQLVIKGSGALITTVNEAGGSLAFTAPSTDEVYLIIPYSTTAAGNSVPGLVATAVVSTAGRPVEPATAALYVHLDAQGLSAPLRVPGISFDTEALTWVYVYISRHDPAAVRAADTFERLTVVAECVARKSTDFYKAREVADEVVAALKNKLITFTAESVPYGLRLFEAEIDTIPAPEDAGEDAMAIEVRIMGNLEADV